MKKTPISVLLILFASIVQAQQLSLFNINSDDYPVIKANFYAFSSRGKQLTTFSKKETRISENGNEQRVIRVKHPEYKELEPTSFVIAIDISGSMMGERIRMTKMATKSFIDVLPLDISECAITSFDDYNYINTDFTQNRERLLKTVDDLTPNGGTNYEAAFRTPLTGALAMAKGGKDNKVIIFITDGLGTAKQNEIITQAKTEGITIHCVTINTSASSVLRNISKETNGRCFEKVRTKEQAKQIYNHIFFESQGIKPGIMEWESNLSCDHAKKIAVSVPSVLLTNNEASYVVPVKSRLGLYVEEKFIDLKKDNPQKPVEKPFTITANHGDFILLSAKISHPSFALVNPSFPITIKKGESKTFVLKHSAHTRTIEKTDIVFESNQCEPLIIQARRWMSEDAQLEIEITHPNGGEVFYTGMDTTITWSGTIPDDLIQLQFSSNNGKTWDTIINQCNGLKFDWKIPNITGDKMLVKANAYLSPNLDQNEKIYERKEKMYGVSNVSSERVFINADNTEFIAERYGEIAIYNLKSGDEIYEIYCPGNYCHARYSEDGKHIIVYEFDKYTEIYDAKTHQKVKDAPIIKKRLPRFGMAKNKTARTFYQFFSGKNTVVDVLTGKTIYTLPQLHESIYLHEFSDTYLIGATRQHTYVWDINSKSVAMLIENNAKVEEAILTRDNKYLVLLTDHPNEILIYDLKTKKLKNRFKRGEKYAFGMHHRFSQRLMAAKGDLLICKQDSISSIIQISTGKVLDTVPQHSRFVRLSDDGQYCIGYTSGFFSGSDNEFNVYKLKYFEGPNSGEDQSDNTFSIIKPLLQSKDLDLGKVLVGRNLNKVMNDFVRNTYDIDIPITNMYITGNDSDAFSVISQPPPLNVIKKGSIDCEFQFMPTKAGFYGAEIVISTPSGTIRQKIKGEGIQPGYTVINKTIDLGKVAVGSSKDSVIAKAISNTSQETIPIMSMDFIDPGKSQFSIKSKTDFKLKPGKSKNLTLTFSPKKRGKISTWINISSADAIQNQRIHVYAEGIAPRTYRLKGLVLNRTTNEPVVSTVSYRDADSFLEAKEVNVDKKGRFEILLNSERSYIIHGSHTQYYDVYDTIKIRSTNVEEFTRRQILLKPKPILIKNDSSSYIEGKVIDKNSNMPLAAVISYQDSKGIIKTTNSDSLTGKYVLELKPDQSYGVVVSSSGYLPISSKVVAPAKAETKTMEKDDALQYLSLGETIQMENVLFIKSRAELLPESFNALDMLSKFLSENPDIKIELLGHTDNQGSANANLKLSSERVETIRLYFIEKGISKKRISGNGYGGSRPISSNQSEATRKLNRRVEFKIVTK